MAQPRLLHAAYRKRASKDENGRENVHCPHDAGALGVWRPDLDRRESRHHENAAHDGHDGEIDGKPPGCRLREESGRIQRVSGRGEAADHEADIKRDDADDETGDRRRQEHDAAGGEIRAKSRADCDRNREFGEIDADDEFVSAHEFDERGRKRHNERADEPEQRHHYSGPPQPRIGPQIFHEFERGAEGVAVDFKSGRRLRSRRDCFGHEPAGHGKHHHQAAEESSVASIWRRHRLRLRRAKLR